MTLRHDWAKIVKSSEGKSCGEADWKWKEKKKGYGIHHIFHFSPQARSLTEFSPYKKCTNHDRKYIYSPQVKMEREKKGGVIAGPSENVKNGAE